MYDGGCRFARERGSLGKKMFKTPALKHIGLIYKV
jgi:hypothetical protein